MGYRRHSGSLDFSHTCPRIDKAIEQAKDELRDQIHDLLNESCPLCQEPDDFDAESAASLIPQAWFECMGDASTHVADVPRDLGWVPGRLSGTADQMHARILDSKDACWLLVLAVNHPEWAEPAMRALRDLCKATPTWANWEQHAGIWGRGRRTGRA